MTNIPTVCNVTLLAVLLSPFASATADEGTIKKLPKMSAIYLWTEDFPELLQASATILEPQERFAIGAIVESAIEKSTIRLDQPRDDDSITQQARFVHFWNQLVDVECFPGEVILILPIDSSSMYLSSTFEHAAPQVGAPMLLAATPCDHDEIEALLIELSQILNEDKLQPSDQHAIEPELELGGHWDCREGWFCWTDEEKQTQSLLDYVTNVQKAPSPLAEDRILLNGVQHLGPRRIDGAPISVYATERAIPLFAWRLAAEVPGWRQIRYASWQWTRLNELRSLVGRVTLGSETLETKLNAPIALEAFLSMTQPRRGPIRAARNAPLAEFDFGLPTLSLPIQRFSQWLVDGDEWAEGSLDVRRTNPEGMVVNRRDVEDFRNRRVEFLRAYDAMAETLYDTSSLRNTSLSNSSIQQNRVADFGKYAREMDRQLGFQQVPLSHSDLLAPLDQLPETHTRIWGESNDSVMRRQSSKQEQLLVLEVRKSHYDEFKEKRGSMYQRQRAIGQQLFDEDEEAWQERYSTLLASLQIDILRREAQLQTQSLPMSGVIDGWQSDMVQNLRLCPELLTDNYGRQHPDLASVREAVEQINASFDASNELCGIFAAGPTALARRYTYFGTPKTNFFEGGTEHRFDSSLSWGTREWIDQFLKMAVATVVTNEKGFRIQGAILVHDVREQEDY